MSEAIGSDVSSTDDMFLDASISRNRDIFLRELLRELAGVLETSVGIEEAEGFVSLVGGRIGHAMNEDYRQIAGTSRLDVEQVAGALVDLKRRIDGGFRVESIDQTKISLVNDACPFGEYVDNRPSLCMMTSNVFGRIASDNLGYARVVLDETIATGSSRCRVEVRFDPGQDGIEYYGDVD